MSERSPTTGDSTSEADAGATAALRGRPRRKASLLTKLLALAMTTIICVVVAEIAVRIAVPVRNVGPAFTEYDAALGKRLKRSFTCRRITPEFTMRLTTNSLGFRGPEPAEPPRNVVLFLGDSFTLGYGVSDGEEYPALVRRALADRFPKQKIEVINAGIGNQGNGRWIKMLRDELPVYEPRVVVLQVAGNDFADNLNDGLFRLSPEGELVELAVPEAGALRRIQQVVEAVPGLSYSHLLGLVKQAMLGARMVGAPTEAAGAQSAEPAEKEAGLTPEEELTFRLIDEAAAQCADRDWPVLMLSVEVDGERMAELRRRCAAAGIPLLEVPGKADRPGLYYEVDGHWRPAGHVFVAELMMHELEARPKLLDASRASEPADVADTSR